MQMRVSHQHWYSLTCDIFHWSIQTLHKQKSSTQHSLSPLASWAWTMSCTLIWWPATKQDLNSSLSDTCSLSSISNSTTPQTSRKHPGQFWVQENLPWGIFLWFCRMSSTFYVFKIDAILMIALMENVKNSLWMIQWHGNSTCLSRSCREIILGFWLACSFHFSNEMILIYSTTQKRLTGNGTRVDRVKQSATRLVADSRTKHHHLPAEDLYRRERTPHSKFCNSW